MEKENQNSLLRALCSRHIVKVCRLNKDFRELCRGKEQTETLIDIEISYLLSKINLSPALVRYTNAVLANVFNEILMRRAKRVRP